MSKQLPASHTVADVQGLVRALLAGHKERDGATAERIRAYHPRFADVDDAGLFATAYRTPDAELTIAREYGFATWRQLMVYVERWAGLDVLNSLRTNWLMRPSAQASSRLAVLFGFNGAAVSRSAACSRMTWRSWVSMRS